MGNEALARGGAEHRDARDRLDRGNQPLVHRERADRSGDVAAGAAELDDRPLHVNLAKGEGDETVRGGAADDPHLAGGGDSAAQAVDLPAIRVRAAERGEDDRLSLRGIEAGQVSLV